MQPKKSIKLLQVFFHLLYHEFAWSYDLVAWVVSLGLWNRWIRTVIPYLSSGTILELGHGPGHLQKQATLEGFKFLGIDLSPQMGRICRQRLEKARIKPKLIRASGNSIPLSDHSISQIVATFPTEYIYTHSSVREMGRILKPGGSIIILPMAWITGKTILQKFFAWLFKVAGQSSDINQVLTDHFIEGFKQFGFTVEILFIDITKSTVLLLKISKPD